MSDPVDEIIADMEKAAKDASKNVLQIQAEEFFGLKLGENALVRQAKEKQGQQPLAS